MAAEDTGTTKCSPPFENGFATGEELVENIRFVATKLNADPQRTTLHPVTLLAWGFYEKKVQGVYFYSRTTLN